MDFGAIFNGQALTLEQFTDATKSMKLADLASGKYVDAEKLARIQGELDKAKATIANLEKAGSDADALRKELDGYKKAEDERKKQEEAERKEKATRDRFAAVTTDKRFASEYAQRGVYQDFVAALADPANIGKGDAQLFEALTKDKAGIFENPHTKIDMGGFKSGGKSSEGLTKEAIMQIKDRDERRKAIAENLELFE